MKEDEKMNAKENKKIETMLKRVMRETDKMLRQNKGFSSFVSPRAAV